MIPPDLLKEIIDGLLSGEIVVQHVEQRYDTDFLHSPTLMSGSGVMQHMPGPMTRRIHLELLDLSVAISKGQLSAPGGIVAPNYTSQTSSIATVKPVLGEYGNKKPLDPRTDPRDGLINLGELKEWWVGYRDFKTNLSKDGLLMSRNDHVWPPYEPLVAVCTKKGVEHDPPVANCDCGIYAYDTPDHKELKAEGGIWGEVRLWGDTFRCATGYRAEYAYPQSLFMKDAGTKAVRRLQEHLIETYGVPVHLVDQRTGKTATDIISDQLEQILKDDLW